MDIAVVQTKVRPSLQFLPVILLERVRGGERVRWKLKAGPVAVPQKEHVESLFIQQARQRQTLHSSPVRLAQGPQEENLWKEHSPQPQAGKDYVFILCVRSHVYALMRLLMPLECNAFLVL